MTEAQHRDKIERDLVREYAQTGRTGELSTPEFQRALAQRHVAAGVARPADREKAREGSYNNLRKMTRELDAFMRDDLASDPKTQDLLGTEAHDEMRASAFQAAGLPMPPDLKRKNMAAQKAQDKEASVRPPDQFERDRAETIKAVDDEYAADPDKRKIYNGMDHKQARLNALKAKGLATERDAETRPGLRGVGIGVFGMVGGINQAVRGGEGVGNAVGQIAQGLERGVTSAASGFIRAGEVALGLFLSPFGKAGTSLGRMAGGLGGGMLAALQAGGAVAGGVVKAGAGLIGGAAGLGAGAVGAGLGAVVGSVAPGIGTLVGAGLGAGIAGGIMGSVGGVLSSLGGAIGQMLSGIGDAVGKLADGIGNALSNVQGVLSDLISTGKDFASAAFTVQRGMGQSLGNAGGIASLAKILTGNPGGLNGMFSGFGGLYLTQKAQAFGINVGANADPLSILGKAQGTFNRYGGGVEGSIRRGEMMQVLFGNSPEIANLLSSGMAGKAVAMARSTAPTPKEMRQDFAVAFDLQGVGRQLDSIKMKLETALMPAIKLGVGVFGTFLNKNMGAITGGLEKFGAFLFVKGPSMFQGLMDGLFELGKTFATLVPKVAAFGVNFYKTFAILFDALMPIVKVWAAGILLPLVGLGRVKPEDYNTIRTMKGLDPYALDDRRDPKTGKMDGVLYRANSFAYGDGKHKGLYQNSNDAEWAFDKHFPRMFGDEKSRQATLDAAKRGMNESGGGAVNINLNGKFSVENNPDALYRLKGDVTSHVARQMVRAESRAGGG